MDDFIIFELIKNFLPHPQDKIPDETLDALITGNFPRMHFDDSRRGHSDDLSTSKGDSSSGQSSADRQDIQTLFNNLANVIAECTELRDKIEVNKSVKYNIYCVH